MSRKKKKNKGVGSRRNNYDYHHIFFQKKHWSRGYAKVLREHPYCGSYIPQATLHRGLHSKIHDVPVPNGNICRFVLKRIDEWLDCGFISVDDNLERKISILADCLRPFCPATTAILDWQREVVAKFYRRGE